MAELIKYFHDFDLVKNRVLNFKLHPITTSERNTLTSSLDINDKGITVYDTDLNTLFNWNGSIWVSLSNDTNTVHISGAENITGTKTFTNALVNSAPTTANSIVRLTDLSTYALNNNVVHKTGESSQTITGNLIFSGNVGNSNWNIAANGNITSGAISAPGLTLSMNANITGSVYTTDLVMTGNGSIAAGKVFNYTGEATAGFHGTDSSVGYIGWDTTNGGLLFSQSGRDSLLLKMNSDTITIKDNIANRYVLWSDDNRIITSLTTNGSFGAATFINGVLNIPQYTGGGGGAAGVSSVLGTINRITSSGGANPTIDIDAAYIGQSSITTLGTITTGIWHGTIITDSYISSASTWNAKQPQLNGTGFVKASGTTISYDNSTYITSSYTGFDTRYKLFSYVPAWSEITGKPTTLSGYGITDAQSTLVSGVNIRTINGQSLLGSTDLVISGAGGSVTSFGFTNANGISGTVTNSTTTPNLTLTLGAISPTSVNGVSAATIAFLDATSSIQTQLNNSHTVVDSKQTSIVINALDYGVTTDSSDNTLTLQAAIDATPYKGTLYVPAGTYNTKSLHLKSNMTFTCDGTLNDVTTPGLQVFNQLTLQRSDHCLLYIGDNKTNITVTANIISHYEAIAINNNCSNIIIKNSYLQGYTSNTFSGILGYLCNNVQILNTTVTNFGPVRTTIPVTSAVVGTGMRLLTIGNLSVKDCKIYNNGENGIFTIGCYNVILDNNESYSNGLSGIQIAFTGSQTEVNYKIVNNNTHNNSADGIDINNGGLAQFNCNYLIENNTANNNGFVGSTPTADGSGIVTIDNLNNVNVINNYSANSNREAITIGNSTNIIVKDNFSDKNTFIKGGFGLLYFTNNTFPSIDIDENQTGNKITIENNNLSNIGIKDTSVTITEVNIFNNILSNVGLNIGFNGTLKLVDNIITGNSANYDKPVINIESNMVKVAIEDNSITNSTNNSFALTINPGVTNCVIGRNKITSSGACIRDLGSINSIISENKLITISGNSSITATYFGEPVNAKLMKNIHTSPVNTIIIDAGSAVIDLDKDLTGTRNISNSANVTYTQSYDSIERNLILDGNQVSSYNINTVTSNNFNVAAYNEGYWTPTANGNLSFINEPTGDYSIIVYVNNNNYTLTINSSSIQLYPTGVTTVAIKRIGETYSYSSDYTLYASTSQSGILSFTDWNTFNGKVSLTGTETLTNKTLTSPQLNSPLLNTTSTTGYVWTATDTAGAGSWQAASGGSGISGLTTNQFVYASSGTAIASTSDFIRDTTNNLFVFNKPLSAGSSLLNSWLIKNHNSAFGTDYGIQYDGETGSPRIISLLGYYFGFSDVAEALIQTNSFTVNANHTTITGDFKLPSLSTVGTAPTLTGATGVVLIDSNGLLSWSNTPTIGGLFIKNGSYSVNLQYAGSATTNPTVVFPADLGGTVAYVQRVLNYRTDLSSNPTNTATGAKQDAYFGSDGLYIWIAANTVKRVLYDPTF